MAAAARSDAYDLDWCDSDFLRRDRLCADRGNAEREHWLERGSRRCLGFERERARNRGGFHAAIGEDAGRRRVALTSPRRLGEEALRPGELKAGCGAGCGPTGDGRGRGGSRRDNGRRAGDARFGHVRASRDETQDEQDDGRQRRRLYARVDQAMARRRAGVMVSSTRCRKSLAGSPLIISRTARSMASSRCLSVIRVSQGCHFFLQNAPRFRDAPFHGADGIPSIEPICE